MATPFEKKSRFFAARGYHKFSRNFVTCYEVKSRIEARRVEAEKTSFRFNEGR